MGPRRETEIVVGMADHLEVLRIGVGHHVLPLTKEVHYSFTCLRRTYDTQRDVAAEGEEVKQERPTDNRSRLSRSLASERGLWHDGTMQGEVGDPCSEEA